MKKRFKIVIASTCTFLVLAALAKYCFYSIMSSMAPEGTSMVYTDLTEPFMLQMKFMLLSGLIGVAIVMGLAFRKQLNMPVGLAIMLLPTALASLITYLFLKTRILSITKTSSEAIGVNTALSMSDIHPELIPVAGLVTATLLAILIIIRNRRELTTPEAPLQTEGKTSPKVV